MSDSPVSTSSSTSSGLSVNSYSSSLSSTSSSNEVSSEDSSDERSEVDLSAAIRRRRRKLKQRRKRKRQRNSEALRKEKKKEKLIKVSNLPALYVNLDLLFSLFHSKSSMLNQNWMTWMRHSCAQCALTCFSTRTMWCHASILFARLVLGELAAKIP